MKSTSLLSLIVWMSTSSCAGAAAFHASSSSSSFTPGTSAFATTNLAAFGPASSRTMTMEYIPSGMSKEQWKKIKEQERVKNQGKDLSKVGITTFQSRSFLDWQKSGGRNLFPVDPTKVKDPSKVPYMQRPGGKADGSDLKKGKAAAASSGGGGLFSFGGQAQKKDDTPPPSPPSQGVNWWTLK